MSRNAHNNKNGKNGKNEYGGQKDALQQQEHPSATGSLRGIVPPPNGGPKQSHERRTLWGKRPPNDANREQSHRETWGQLAGHDHAPNVSIWR